ncbi:Hsp20/alpha crystallin family protein [Candidatus Pacearchaeota archaeon]|nr:Hsp20/alpha crystallin family protein [Candidatus Pacearchaeota archaeon]
MKHNSKQVEIEFELPGFDKKDIKINLSKNFASIRAEKEMEIKVKRKEFFHDEKIYRSFSYSTTLPSINPRKAKTKFINGTLKIIAPKDRR